MKFLTFTSTAIAIAIALAGGEAQASPDKSGVPGDSAGSQGKPKVPTIEQLAAFPKFSNFSVSPDGKHIVALQAFGEEQHILVWAADNLQAKPVEFGSARMKIRSVAFVKNDTLLVSLWQPYDNRLGGGVVKTFVNKVMLVDIDGKNWRDPMPREVAKSDLIEKLQATWTPTLISSLPDDPDHILLASNSYDNGDIYRVNVRKMTTERVLRIDPSTGSYMSDRNGNIRARHKFGSDDAGSYVAVEVRPIAGGGWEQIEKSYAKERTAFDITGFTDDPNLLIISSNRNQDKLGLYEYDLAARKIGNVVFKNKYFDAEGLVRYRYSGNPSIAAGEIIGVAYNGPIGGDVVWTNGFFKKTDENIRTALGIAKTPLTLVDPATGESSTVPYDQEKFYRIVSYSADASRFVISVQGAGFPPEFYLVRDGELTLLAKQFPDIDPASLGTTSLTYYKARDGLDIPAFLTKPNARLCGPGPWPAVVHPHGGPWARDHMDYDWSSWVPLMASRCMAVLRPQYRGSNGWGLKLWKAGDAEWGQKMQDDKDDGAKWMIEQKIAIPNRIAMFGFSYGGYASMVASIRPNGLYKCAIAGAGVSDIKQIWESFYDNRYFRQHQAPTVKGLNPLEHASRIQIPVMVYQGMRDRIVPPEQSKWFVDQARKSDQPVEYHEIADYSHGEAWTREILGQQLRYIDDYFRQGCGGNGL